MALHGVGVDHWLAGFVAGVLFLAVVNSLVSGEVAKALLVESRGVGDDSAFLRDVALDDGDNLAHGAASDVVAADLTAALHQREDHVLVHRFGVPSILGLAALGRG